MAADRNGGTKLVLGVVVLVFVGYNAWVGANIVDIRERVACMDTKIDMLMTADEDQH